MPATAARIKTTIIKYIHDIAVLISVAFWGALADAM
jgi:hypothetical protein